MTAARLLIIQPDETDPAGPLGTWLADAGAELELRRPPADAIPTDPAGYRGLVVLGGGMDADADTEHPWLADIRRLLSRSVATDVPVLGVCLGGQLLAAATGGGVHPGAEGPEIGPALVSKRDAAWTDPLFADLPLVQDVMHFHRDVIDPLPGGAELLATSPRYPHQAFRVGRHGYGLQFHIETTTEIVRAWAEQEPELAEFARPDALDETTLHQKHADIAETWQPFAERFVQLCAGELEPATPRPRTLPMA